VRSFHDLVRDALALPKDGLLIVSPDEMTAIRLFANEWCLFPDVGGVRRSLMGRQIWEIRDRDPRRRPGDLLREFVRRHP
jgi:hypothetical protein